MALRTNKIFPLSGEAGNGGGIVQVKYATRSGEFSYSSDGASSYKTVLTCSINCQSSDNKVLIFMYADGIADRGGNEWEGWLGLNANNTSNDSVPTSWTTLAMLTGLGTWDTSNLSIGTFSMHHLHHPNTTSNTNYSIICNRRSTSHWNNEFTGSNARGTSIILLEVAS